VVQDPRTDVSLEAMAAQFELARTIWEEISLSHDAIRRIRDLRGQVEEMAERVDSEAVSESTESIAGELTSIEERIHQTKAESSQDILNFTPRLDNQLLYLQGVVESTVGAPLASSRERFAELEAELNGLLEELDAVVADRLPELERLLDEAGAPHVVPPADRSSP
jgi:DNA repair exonuclease SbcCD ATPase subunit